MKTTPKIYREAIDEGRLPAVSFFQESVKRVSQETADKRNRWILKNCDDILFIGVIDPSGTLAQLATHRQKCSENSGFKVRP